MEPQFDSSSNEESCLRDRLEKLIEDIRRLPLSRVRQLERVMKVMEKRAVGIAEAAEVLEVSQDTIRRAIKAGTLKAFRIGKSGMWKISIEEIERLLKDGRHS